MTLKTNLIYRYKPFQMAIEAHCRLRVFAVADTTVFMLTEVADNPGMSVTNAWEHLATALINEHKVSPENALWIEHYPARGDRRETYDFVTFHWQQATAAFGSPRHSLDAGVWQATNPQWRNITMEEAEIMTGANLSQMNQALADLGFETLDGSDFDEWDAWEV